MDNYGIPTEEELKTAEKKISHDIPRRVRIDLMTPAELAITNAMYAVEEAGCDVRLTEAVVLLRQSRDKVADYYDKVFGGNLTSAV